MADEKLTGLPSAPSADDLDLLYVVDVSDTTDDASGTSKSIEVADLLAGTADASHTHVKADITDFSDGDYATASHTHVAADIDAEASTDGYVLTSDGAGNAAWEAASGGGGGGQVNTVVGGTDITVDSSDPVNPIVNYTGTGGGAAGGNGTSQFLIDTQTITNEDVTVTLPEGYDELRIRMDVQSDRVGNAVQIIRGWFNGDETSGNYHSQLQFVSNGAAADTEVLDSYLCQINSASAPADALSTVWLHITQYGAGAYTNVRTECTSLNATAHAYVGQCTLVWKDSSAATSLRIESGDEPTSGITGTVRVYGVRDVSLEDSETITTKVEVPVVLNAGAFEIDLTNYQDGDRVILEGSIYGTGAAEAYNLRVWLNDNTTLADYRSVYDGWSSNVVSSGEFTSNSYLGTVVGSTGLADASPLKLTVENYTSNDRHEVTGLLTSQRTASRKDVFRNNVFSDDVAPVTKITIHSDGDPLAGTIKCYIEKQGVLPVPSYTDVDIDMPVVQSAKILSDSTVASSSEAGWSCVSGGTGIYDITFPTAAASADDQQIVVTANRDDNPADVKTCFVANITATGCKVKQYSQSNLNGAQDFSIIRRLPDENVVIGGVLQTEDVNIDMPVVQSVSYERLSDGAGVVFSSEPGWSVVERSAGIYDITFPTAASSAKAQSLVASAAYHVGELNLGYALTITDMTPTTCVLYVTYNQSASDIGWHMHRRLPDTPVVAGGVLQTEAMSISLPVVQSAHFNSGGDTVLFSTEPGWSITSLGTGYYEVTCPTSAVDAASQVIVGTVDALSDTAAMNVSIHAITANTFRVNIDNNSGTNLDRPFHITRRLPDVTGATGSPLTRMGKHEIQTITNTTAGDFEFTNIPQGFKRLIIQGYVGSDAAVASQALHVFFNGDETATNYFSQRYYMTGTGTTPSEGDDSYLSSISADSLGKYSQVEYVLEGYATTGLFRKKIRGTSESLNSNDQLRLWEGMTIHDSLTDPVTSLLFRVSTTTGIGELTLYGEY